MKIKRPTIQKIKDACIKYTNANCKLPTKIDVSPLVFKKYEKELAPEWRFSRSWLEEKNLMIATAGGNLPVILNKKITGIVIG